MPIFSIAFMVCCLLLLPTLGLAGPRELTVFIDGTLVELEATARKGSAEVQFPGALREDTLRVTPLDNGLIGRVELVPARVPDKLQKELDSLQEQKSRLEDRMKALDTRETIFAAAAKSQSSKAPRKTKTNPDPLTSVRQGTEFAIAQLEAVFTARRRTEQELKRVTLRLAQLERRSIGGPTVRVALSSPNSRIRVSAVLQENDWIPRYELRLDGTGTAQLALLTEFEPPTGFGITVIPAALTASPLPQGQTAPGTTTLKLAAWQLPLEQEQVRTGPIPAFSLKLRYTGSQPLPAGQVAVYYRGDYLGTTPLVPLSADNTLTLVGPR